MSCLSAPFIAFVGCNGLLGHRNFWPIFVMTTLLIAIESTRLMVSDIFAATGRARLLRRCTTFAALCSPHRGGGDLCPEPPDLGGSAAAHLAVATLQFTVALVFS